MRLRVFTSFSGYDSQLLALRRLRRDFPGIDYECVGWCEIDKYAIQAHNALFPDLADRNFGDIRGIDWEQAPDFDLFTMSSPCQDFSVAGKRAGGEEGSGTRSSLLWECRKTIAVKRPRYILFENVKGLLSGTFIRGFMKWQDELAALGYTNFAQVLNARDYGVPQNRERVFMVSILGFGGAYHFPRKMPLNLCLRDVLEDEPSDRYYLSDAVADNFLWRGGRNGDGAGIRRLGNCYPERRGGEREAQEGRVYGSDGVSPAIVATSYRGTMPKIMAGNMKDGQVTACAIRGRGERGNLHQTLERGGHVANTVTTSHKDSMVMEVFGATQKNAFHGSVDGVSPTLTEAMGMGGGQIPMVKEIGSRQPVMLTPRRTEYGKAVRKDYERGTLRARRSDMTELTPRGDGCSNTLTSVRKDNLLLERKTKCRIRRLTERECFRLMDVEERDIDTIQAAGISATQQYRMAGNSIVVACLYHIFRKLFAETGNEERQTRLF